MNLLEHFILQHVQWSVLRSELLRVTRDPGMHEAKVELNLTPRLLEPEENNHLPSYQVSARLRAARSWPWVRSTRSSAGEARSRQASR